MIFMNFNIKTDNNMMISPAVISIFSGCGGLDLGFHSEGYNIVWANDFSETAVQSYRENFGNVIVEGDITKIDPYTDKSIPSCDMVIGGFPCQDFSIIWKRPGLSGKRGGLYRHFLDFVDAKNQKRSLQKMSKDCWAEKVPYNNEQIGCMDKTRKMLELIPEGGNFTDIPKDNPLYVKGMISHVYRRINRNEPAKTIIAAGGGGTWGYHYPEPRPLTNRERARLQSFPDDFKFVGSIAEVRRQIGNAVPPLGIRPVAKQLMPLFTGDYIRVDLQKQYEKLKKLSVKERLDIVTAEMYEIK